MKAYFLVAKRTWDEYVIYRLNFVMWRIRTVLQLLTTYFLWFLVMPSNGSLFGYTKAMMLTYVLLSDLFGSIVFSGLTGQVGDEINSGDLSNYLVKPMNYMMYWFSRDIGDKAMNISFAIGELALFIVILHPPFFLQTNMLSILLTVIALTVAIVIYFFINFLLGTIGFWSSEVWAPRFIFTTLLGFFSGAIFPLDIVPKGVFALFQLLPFGYLLYFPLKIYLGQIPMASILYGMSVSFIWVILLYLLVGIIWKKGLLVYTAQGK